MFGEDSGEGFLEFQHVFHVNLHVGGLSLRPAEHLVDHHVGVREGEAFAGGAATEQHGAHAGGLTNAVGVHVAREELHGVIDRQPGGYVAAGGVDVNVDVLLRVAHLQKQHLCDHGVGHRIIDGGAEENDAIHEQTRINIVSAFAATGLFHHMGDQVIVLNFAVGHIKKAR